MKKISAKQGSLGFDGFGDVVLRPLGLACGRNVPHKVWNFEKAQEFCKHCLKGHPGGSLENHNAERNMNSRKLVHQNTEENKDTIKK